MRAIEQQDAQVVPGLPKTSNVVVDDNLSSEFNLVETHPPKRTHINLEASENSHGRPLVRRNSPNKHQRSTGSLHNCRKENDHHKRLQTELAWQQPRSLEDTSSISEPQTPLNSASATSEGKISCKFWKRQSISPENSLVYDVAKLYLQAEVCRGQPRPSAAVTENMVDRAWALALE